MLIYAHELSEMCKKQFSKVLSHDLHWENKTQPTFEMTPRLKPFTVLKHKKLTSSIEVIKE